MKKFLLIFFISIFIFAAGTEPDIIAPYLEKNSHPLDLDNLDLSCLGEDLNCQVFLSGAQWHGTTANYDLHLALITALHEQTGVKYLLLDSGYASAQVYNDYLQTGDIAFLKMGLEGIRYSNSSNDEHRAFWQKLHEYNRELPPEERIAVVGIDVEYQINTTLSYLNHISGNQFIDKFPVLEYLGHTTALGRYVEELENHYRDNPGIFEDIFGDNLPCFDLILQNLADTVAAQFSADFYASREQVMYENFLRAHSRDPQGKFFAHLTMEHIYQRQVKIGSLADANRLGMLLCQEDSPAQGVVSIGALYRDSEFRFYYGRYWNYDVFNSFIDNPPLFQTAAVSDYTLFKLAGDNSPFSWGPYSIINPTGGAATDYYQYMLLIKNSLPATPNLLPPAH